MADFVWDYSLGLVVDRLGDIKEKIAALPDDEYKKMKDNVRCVSKAVHNGGFFAKALERAELSL